MKVTDKLTVLERTLAGILFSVLVLSGVIVALVGGILVIPEFFSWESLFLVVPTVTFIGFMCIYIYLLEKEDDHV